jgi:hypothetical protein
MKKILIFPAMLLSFFAWSSNAFAGETKGGYISSIATVNGVILFQISGGAETGHVS